MSTTPGTVTVASLAGSPCSVVWKCGPFTRAWMIPERRLWDQRSSCHSRVLRALSEDLHSGAPRFGCDMIPAPPRDSRDRRPEPTESQARPQIPSPDPSSPSDTLHPKALWTSFGIWDISKASWELLVRPKPCYRSHRLLKLCMQARDMKLPSR